VAYELPCRIVGFFLHSGAAVPLPWHSSGVSSACTQNVINALAYDRQVAGLP
jgi:hypothetical protein